MTQEEKAKAYDEAIERAKQLPRISAAFDRFTIERIFPELKESEEEQSKKWILEYLYDGLRKSDEQFKDDFKTAIAWLKKQGDYNGLVEKAKARNETHWQDVRERAAIAAMQGVMNFFGSIDYNRDTIAKLAVEQADALIEQLKKK